jgi:hypothetical protein
MINQFFSTMEKTRGGAREGSGRKPKADEIRLIETMDAIAAPESVWIALYQKAESGDTNAIKTWLQYRYGMPKQIVEQTNINIEEKDLTSEEIKLIRDNIKDAY